MKHIFIANPAAGHTSSVGLIRQEVLKLSGRYDCFIHETLSPGEATRFVRHYCEENPNENVRFYACGGDGTLNEVMSGVIGFQNASISCYPCGSGNDFVKYYGTERFLSIPALLAAEEREIDILTDGERYSMNVANFGFDYAVCRTMTKIKRRPLMGGKNGYYAGVCYSLFTSMNNKAKVYVDGKKLGEGDSLLLCTVSNGSYVGGSYRCAPRSDNEDGLLEVCLFKPVSVAKFLGLMNSYTMGTHLAATRFAGIMR
ncbi:MAG: hypothetical protein MJ078_04105, partial [Clostridia bacterium]|nr:hypothetical protein [Clostridia bacterium]